MLETKVSKFLSRNRFSFENKKVVIGVSGGPDSMALLHYLWSRKEQWNVSIAAAHVDHMFRGVESYEDALFVKHYCEKYSIPFEMKRINVPQIIEETNKSSQVAARDCRFHFFSEVMEEKGYSLLVLAHHGDDQVETMLMRLTRGSTGKARAGIPFKRTFDIGHVIRPFLCVTKADIEDYCLRNMIDFRRDPSNEKGHYSRNRFRKEVLPFLKSENPAVHEQFQRFSEELTEDEALLEELTAANMNTVIIKREKELISMDIDAFAAMPMPLQRRGIQLILNYLYEAKPSSLAAVHIEQVHSLLQSPQPSGKLDFPAGLKIIRSYRQCHFTKEMAQEETESYHYEMEGPGTLLLPNGHSLTMEICDVFIPSLHSNQSLFAENDVNWPFIVRTRENGDRMMLKGLHGSKKIKDLFIDQKIPLTERNRWPIVTDGEGKIIWLPGLKRSAHECDTKGAKSYILFTYN